jgi:hypothetical protein
MHGIIYDPDDRKFIEMALDFCEHIPACKDCEALVAGEGRQTITTVFKCLNQISMHPIPDRDYAAAVEFCERWLQINETLQFVDSIIGVTHGDTIQ